MTMTLNRMIGTFVVIGSLLQLRVLSFVLNNNLPIRQRGGEPNSFSKSSSSSCLHVSSTIPFPTSSSLDEYLLEFAEIVDESKRRADFEKFVRTQLMEGGLGGVMSSKSTSSSKSVQSSKGPAVSGYNSKDMYFLDRVTDGLIRLGEAIQDRSWDKYVDSGFQEDIAVMEDKQLWACIDMLIQLKVLAKQLKQQHNPKLASTFRSGGFPLTTTRAMSGTSTSTYATKKPNVQSNAKQSGKTKKKMCGMCDVCSCSKKNKKKNAAKWPRQVGQRKKAAKWPRQVGQKSRGIPI